MNVLKLFLIAVSGLGVGFTTTQVIGHEEVGPINQEQEAQEEYYGYGCHRYRYGFDYFLDNFLSHYSEDNQALILAYAEQWLLEQEVTLEEVEEEFELRHDFMYALHEFVEEQQLEEIEDVGYHGHGHMGW